MEAEVLRSQLQVTGEELVRLRGEVAARGDELARGRPRLAQLEDVEAECLGAMAELEAVHSQEMAEAAALHQEELASLRSAHAARVAEAEASQAEEVGSLRLASAEELGRLRSELEAARWEADVHAREQRDAVRELSLRQRENTRLSRRRGEARQEALEHATRLEVLSAQAAGAPAREAELRTARQRLGLLEQTAAEWREALSRKHTECISWRRRALARGSAEGEFPNEAEAELGDLAELEWAPPSRLACGSPSGASARSGRGAAPAEGGSPGGRSALPAPAGRAAALGRSPGARWPAGTPGRSPAAARPAAPGGAAQKRLALGPAPRASEAGGRPRAGIFQPADAQEQERMDEDRPAEEFSAAALRAARLAAALEAEEDEGGRLELAAALGDAENDVEMLVFLLDEADAGEAEALLGLEVQRQPLPVAKRLRAQMRELRRGRA
ncbi:unnamed protein product [Prorocentrum cordatum]|uniref:Uncharacterized protein n=1 Tax=Prorocentrum cordatum TaxID=2364126 RepID=A0ABN9TN16_9DINO|nr:unnamed protein product [Polarella glacialis]